MKQIEYQGSAESVGFAPVTALDQTPAMQEQLDRRLRWMRENQEMRNDDRAAVSRAISQRNQVNAQSREQNLEALSTFSSTLQKNILNFKKVKDEADEAEGLNMAYMDGLPPAVVNGFDAAEKNLDATDDQLQQVGDEVQKQGAPFEVVDRLRSLSGKRAVGYARGRAELAGMNYGAWVMEALEKDSKTEIVLGDKKFTPATAEGTAEKSAALAILRSKYMQMTGMTNANPALLNKYAWPEMKKADFNVLQSYAKSYRDKKQNEAQDTYLNDFTQRVATDPTVFTSTVANLMRNGKSPREARETVMKLLLSLQDNGQLTPEQVQAVEDSPSFDGVTSNGDKFKPDWIEVKRRGLEAREAAFRLQDAEEARQKKDWADAVVTQLEAGTYDEGAVDAFIAKSREWYNGYVDPRILDYRQNRTLQANTKNDQRRVLEGMASSNALSLNELKSGKYTYDLVKEFTPEATRQDQMRQPEVTKAKESIKKRVQDALLGKLGNFNTGDRPHWSVEFATDDALRRIDRNAAALIATGTSPEEAYSQATLPIIKEIEAAQDNKGSPFSLNGKIGPEAGFAAWTNGSTAGMINNANQNLNYIRSKVMGGGAASIQQEKLLGRVMTQEEISKLRSTNVAPPPIVGLMASWSQGKMSEFDIINSQLKLYGFPERQKPVTQGWADTTLTPELQRLLNVKPTSARTARAYYASGSVPQSVRTGPQGFGDVIALATASGSRNPAAVAAMWALESGYGTAKSGRNNVMGQKGQGSRVLTQEDGAGGMYTTMAEFKDYSSPIESIQDHMKLWDSFSSDTTPREAIRSLLRAGYATDRNYESKAVKILRDNGINPDRPFVSGPMIPGGSVFRESTLMSPGARNQIKKFYEVGGAGPAGPNQFGDHADFKPVRPGTTTTTDSSTQVAYRKGELDQFIKVKTKDGKMVPISQGFVTTDDDRKHRNRGSFGHDYAPNYGQDRSLYLTGGARIISSTPSDYGDKVIIEVPGGKRYALIHGKTKA
jgi:uncharacterized FlgJ-related protein